MFIELLTGNLFLLFDVLLFVLTVLIVFETFLFN